jgi:hypothetical protein
MSLLSRDEFAQAVLIQLAVRGETTAQYDSETFSIVHTPQEDGTNASAWRTQLDRWYEKYQQAASEGRGDEAVADVAENWAHTLKWAHSEHQLNKARLVPLVRSRFDYELSSLRTALQLKQPPRELMQVFVHQPLAEHLDVIIAEDAPDRYNQVTRPLLEQLKVSWDEALRLAMWNLPQIDPGFASLQPLQQRETGYWVYAAEPSELFSSWLLFPEKIRRLPVKGKPVAFVPKVSLLAITGTDEIEALRRLIAMTCEALSKEGGRTVSAIPLVLEVSGWKPWLPPASHPLYWAIKELHITESSNFYDAQKELLDQLLARDQGDEAPFVASYQVGQFAEHQGAAVLTTQCIWPDVDTLLPRTEVVILKPLLNRDALELDENAEPQFGEWVTLTWQQFADYLGPRLKKLDYFPERYQVREEDFPVGEDWQRLSAAQPTLPLEGLPGAKPAPLPKLAAGASGPAASASAAVEASVSPTQLARPFSPPQDLKPPPQPSLWPLALLVLFGLTCLGGSIGVLVVGIQWVHGALQNVGAGDAVAAAPDIQPPQPNPFPQPVPVRPLPPPAEIPNVEPIDQAKFDEEMRQAVRQIEEQIARVAGPNPPDFSPLEVAPQPTEPMPQQGELPPLAPLGKPEQELPALNFGPSDLEPLGREIHGEHLFQDIAPPGGWLVGLRATKGKPWNGAIVALQPIYQVAGEYQLGQQCGSGQQALAHAEFLAKPGYAIGKIEARLGLIMNAVRIHFYRVDGGDLIPADSYATDWFGAEGGGPHTFDAGGSPLVGLAGSFEPKGEVITIQVLRKRP